MSQAPPRNPAETYETYFVPAMFLPWATILMRRAAPRAGEHVLDIACGTGIVARQVAPLVGMRGQVVALDLNPDMLAVARSLPAPAGATIEWREANAMAIPFPAHTFDLVLCQHGLQFFPDRVGALREMRRVLKPGGRVVVIVLQALAQHPVFEALMQSVARQLALPVSAVATPFVLSDAEALRALFVAAGFAAVDVHAESTVAQFAEPERFVPLAVASSAAAIPAFVDLQGPARAALVETVRSEVESTLRRYRDADAVTCSMFAHVAVATV